MRFLVVASVITAVMLSVAKGDEPLPTPTKTTATSSNGRILAVSDPKTGTEVEDLTQHKVLWRLSDWYRSMFVADDGRHLVSQYDGLNLIPLDFRDEFVLLTFWREGRKIREVRVGDLFPDHSILVRTASHYLWRHAIEIDAQDRLKLQRVDGRIFFFYVATGKETKA
jgi:hypothetical protein